MEFSTSPEHESIRSAIQDLVKDFDDDYQDGRYSLGPGTYRLTFLANRSTCLRSVRPVLEKLSQNTGETVSLSVINVSDQLLECMKVVESTRGVRHVVKSGESRPLYCIFAGLVLLAWQDRSAVESYLDATQLERITASMGNDRAAIIERLAVIRQTGHVITVGEYPDDVFGFAAPVFSDETKVIAALSIGAPAARAFQNKESYVSALREAAITLPRMFSGSELNKVKNSWPPPARKSSSRAPSRAASSPPR